MKEFIPKKLPVDKEVETVKLLKKSIAANKALAKLNGVAKIIPNSSVLINSLVLQEAKDSSAIENIITTHDELYKASIDIASITIATKEVQNYRNALLTGFKLVKDNKLLLKRNIVGIQSELEQNNAGVRKQCGTKLKNAQTGEIVFTPPQNYDEIEKLLANLEKYINEPNEIDSLINMAIIHYQFETIHPFYDGNGRTGRIINILYLVLKDLLDLPILYLSRYIIKNKSDYYRLLQEVRTQNNWEDWIFYMLDGIEKTSIETTELINDIRCLMEKTKQKIRNELPRIYSKDLLEVLFTHPYTKIEFLVENLDITRQTATKYLRRLEDINILKTIKIKNSKYFINIDFFEILKKGVGN